MPPSRPTKDRDTKEARVLANRYEIVSKLGSGNCGTAFLCKDIKCGNELKVLKEIAIGDLKPDETVHAIHEAKLLSQLDHPGIVKFLDSFIDGEYFCIITEYCEGGDLSNKIEEYKNAKKSFDEETVLNWTIQLLLAVQYIHSRRVLHRDLKARNIFIRNNLMKIGDFGISRILVNTADMASTFAGTPYYMSPEVLKHEGYNSKSDIWSIGCVMYQLCSLDHAFVGQGLMAVMYKIVEGDPPDLPSKYSRKLNEVFKKMLTKDPDKRPSAEEVLKYQYIAQHMTKMKDTLTDEYKARHTINPETADKEATKLAILLREKSHMNDLTGASGKSKTEGGVLSEDKSQKLLAKKMTPREIHRLKKMQESDKKAQVLIKLTQDQFAENTAKREKIKTTLEKSSLPPWKDGSEEGAMLQQSVTIKESRASKPVSTKDVARGGHYDSDNHGDEENTWSQTVVRRNSERDTRVDRNLGKNQLSRSLSQSSYRSIAEETQTRMNKTIGGTYPDERPITPMRDRMVYNVHHSSLDFKDGIPDTPEEANTFYDQYGDFDDNNDVVTGDETLRDDEENLINHLERALSKGSEKSTFVNDDTVLGAYGPHTREMKIKNMRSECVKTMGEGEFQKAYNYLKKARNSQGGKEKMRRRLWKD